MSGNGEIYTAGKNFTLPPALTALTNSTSGRGRGKENYLQPKRAEVEFVHPVTAGGSVKFLPAV